MKKQHPVLLGEIAFELLSRDTGEMPVEQRVHLAADFGR